MKLAVHPSDGLVSHSISNSYIQVDLAASQFCGKLQLVHLNVSLVDSCGASLQLCSPAGFGDVWADQGHGGVLLLEDLDVILELGVHVNHQLVVRLPQTGVAVFDVLDPFLDLIQFNVNEYIICEYSKNAIY